MTGVPETATAGPQPGRITPCLDRPGDALRNGHRRKATFGPKTPRVLQFLINLQNLPPAQIDAVMNAWKKVNPLNRALAWAHLAAAAKEERPGTAAASAARRVAMDTARMAGRTDWAFWAAAEDAAAAITADGLAEADYQTLTYPLRTVIAEPNGHASTAAWPGRGPGLGDTAPGGRRALPERGSRRFASSAVAARRR
jgi:hypothetical protein